MKLFVGVLSILVFVCTLPGVTPVDVSFDPALPPGWKMKRQQPAPGERETKDDQTFLTSPDGKTMITLQISKKNKTEESGTFEASAEEWKASALSMAKQMGATPTVIDYKISPHRTGKRGSLSMSYAKGEMKLTLVSRYWFESGYVARVAAMSPTDISKEATIAGIIDSIRSQRSSHPSHLGKYNSSPRC